MVNWLSIKKPGDLAELASILPAEFGAQEVVDWLLANLSAAVEGVLVELPYVDKDYRSTYYNYYAKKGASYSPYSARLHLFRKGWELTEAPLTLSEPAESTTPDDGAVDKGYLGFLTLRPTRIFTIGRTVVSPEAIKGARGWLIDHRHKAHVLGHRVHVKGFPFMQQHSDIAVCAHTACWAILRHYSERYALYHEVLVHDISRLGREFDPGGLLPSLGITARDAERIFAAVGTFPLLVAQYKANGDGPRFHDELLAYLDSGFPLFGVQSKRGHAVAVVGYRTDGKLQVKADESMQRAWDYVTHLLVVDDNFRPYMAVPRSAGAADPYAIDAFDAFIVPLPEKMFLSAAAVLRFANELKEAPPEEFAELENDENLVTRCFVTTTASWQRFIRQHASQLPVDFANIALELTMPQFVWVVEYATPAQKAKGEIQARVLLDATAGTYDPFPAFLVHDAKGAFWMDRTNRLPMQHQPFVKPVTALAEMATNLTMY